MPPHESELVSKTTTSNVAVVVKKELLYENHFYDVTEWVKKHPGGKIIEFYTQSGEDATMPIQQFHKRSTKRVMSIMSTLKKRPADSAELSFISPHYKALTQDFTKLVKDFTDEGLFEPDRGHIIGRMLEWLAFMVMSILLANSENIYLRIFGIFLGVMHVGRAGWLQHEGGHHSLTGNPKVDRALHSFFLGFSFGLSGAYWRSQHNRHHAMPQRLTRDIDLETMPIMAFNKLVVKNPKDADSFFIRYQAALFLTVDTLLVALAWKLYLHPRYAWKKGAYGDLVSIALSLVYVYLVGPLNYVPIVWLSATYFLGNFSLSHTHLPVTEESLHWTQFAFAHTTNIDSSSLCDWWMGFLNFQIEHHLFPTMPQFRHPLIAPRVKEFATKHGMPYRSVGYWKAVALSIANLHQVSKDLATTAGQTTKNE